MNRMTLVCLLLAGIVFVACPAWSQAPSPAQDKAGCITRCDNLEGECRQNCADKYGGLEGGRADCEAQCNQKKLNCYQVCDNITDISTRMEKFGGTPEQQPQPPLMSGNSGEQTSMPTPPAKPEEKPYFESGEFEVKTQVVLTPGDMGTRIVGKRWRSILSYKTNRGARGGSGYNPKDGAWTETPPRNQPLMGHKGLYPIKDIWDVKP